jgi:hypothetical protein
VQGRHLRRWIAEGAVYQPHWAYVPVARPPVPRAAESRNPIDAFVAASLAARWLAPSPPTPRRTRLRRLAPDLVGLPPRR